MDDTNWKYEIDTNEDGHVVFLKANYGYESIFCPFSSNDWNSILNWPIAKSEFSSVKLPKGMVIM